MRFQARRSGIESSWSQAFPPTVQTDPEAHTVSYTMGTVSLPQLKRQGRGHIQPQLLESKLKKVQRYIFTPFSVPSLRVAGHRVKFTFLTCFNYGIYELREVTENSNTIFETPGNWCFLFNGSDLSYHCFA